MKKKVNALTLTKYKLAEAIRANSSYSSTNKALESKVETLKEEVRDWKDIVGEGRRSMEDQVIWLRNLVELVTVPQGKMEELRRIQLQAEERRHMAEMEDDRRRRENRSPYNF